MLQLTYEWGYRTVEPYAYGLGKENQELLRAFQTGGASESGDPVGWKLFKVDEIRRVTLLGETFRARQEYRRDDKAMTKAIYAQL